MIKSELPLEPIQRVRPESRAKPAPDGAGEGDFAHWIQQQDPDLQFAQISCAEGTPADHQGLLTAMVLSAPGLATGVLYGWGLRAQTSLSQLVVDTLHGVHTAPGRSSSHSPTAQERSVAPLAIGTVVSSGSDESASSQTQISTSVLRRAVFDRPRATDFGSALTNQEAVAAPLLWSERTLRRISTQDGGSTVWLRDYRLSPREIALALADLLSEPAEANPITRVVINGVEVWRQAPPTS